ncbi:hypothetical protein [Herbaspirillum robiniae]|uniref:Conjugal transfer protein TraD n=1 Tax=Herbaspirillum robiniae TaxID=2014887 RepID=A0ABX2M8Q0_9BURK|nr:hypothetical protein [Herbaspirillum robiniae]NUU04591.1 hypothetical protein [Herbaspirillum robiniae]
MSKVSRRRISLPPDFFVSTERIFDGDSSQQANDDLAASEVFGDDVLREERAICAAESEGLAIHED